MRDIYNIDSYKGKLIEQSKHSEKHIETFIEVIKNRMIHIGVPTFQDVFIGYESIQGDRDYLRYFTGYLYLGLGTMLMHLVEEERNKY